MPYHVVCKTSKWTFTSPRCASAVQALESIIPLVVAAGHAPTAASAGNLLAALEMSGKLDETLFLDNVEVYAGDHL